MSGKCVIFTGGGSGGHVIPALTLIEELSNDPSIKVIYIGSHNGVEKELVEGRGIEYRSISTGKLRRYFSFQNFLDVMKVLKGIFDSLFILLRCSNKKSLVFSTGGFVSVPVVVAAKFLGRTVYVHEQTSQVGLANKITSKFARKVFITFESSKKFFPSDRTFHLGYPLRKDCFNHEIHKVEIRGKDVTKIERPVLFITGGGNGAQILNELIRDNRDRLTEKYFIVHQVGKKFEDEYKKYENENYITTGLVSYGIIDLFKKAHITISRAGAGTVCELMALNKRSIFVPLKIAQKNEQHFNALEAKDKIGSVIINEDDLPRVDILKILEEFEVNNSGNSEYVAKNGTANLIEEIKNGLLND